jgi:hypothetical protein
VTLRTLDRAEVLALLERIDTWTLVPEDGPRLRDLLGLLLVPASALDSTRIIIRKLQRLLFGPRTESRDTGPAPDTSAPDPASASGAAGSWHRRTAFPGACKRVLDETPCARVRRSVRGGDRR